jgi:hypothetical protein
MVPYVEKVIVSESFEEKGRVTTAQKVHMDNRVRVLKKQ